MKKLDLYQTTAMVIIVAIIISEIIIYYPFFIERPGFGILNLNRDSVEYEISSGSYPLDVEILFLSIDESSEHKTVYIYYDPEYQLAGATRKQARGIVDHLPGTLKIMGYEGRVMIINASGLADLLLEKQSATESILVISMGAFPDTVYGLDKNLVKPWVESGGTLFWIGDTFAFYSAEKSRKRLDWNAVRHPKNKGVVDFFGSRGVIILDHKRARTYVNGEYSEALSLSYPYVSRGVNITMVKSMNGKILGKIGKKSTSIASLPLGNGTIVMFGGGIHNEWIVAKDMAQIMNSGAFGGDSKIIGRRNYSLEQNNKIKDKLNFNSSIYGGDYNTDVFIYVYQTDDEPNFFKNIYLKLNSSVSTGGPK